MESVNLTALFRYQPEGSGGSEYSASSSAASAHEYGRAGSVSGTGESSGTALQNYKQQQQRHHTHTNSVHDRAKDDGLEMLPTTKPRTRRHLDGHNNPTDDTLSLRSYWYGLMSPDVYMPIFYAVRITLLVALPLSILARHPKVMYEFPAHVVIPLWGVVDCKYPFGEQVAFSICSIQCGITLMIWGLLNNAWNSHDHPAGWWCSVFFIAFFISLFGDVRARRVTVLQCVLILQMQSLPGGTELIYPVKVGRDMIMATGFAFFQSLWPIKSIAKECDELMAGGWKHIGRIARNAATACWSEDPIECAIALGRIGTEPVQGLLANLPSKLFFVMYEVWESTLRLELRRERLTLMGLCMPRLHTMTDSARAMVMKRVHRAHVGPSPASATHQRKRGSAHAAADKMGEDAPTSRGGRITADGVSAERHGHEPYSQDIGSSDSVNGAADPPPSHSLSTKKGGDPDRRAARGAEQQRQRQGDERGATSDEKTLHQDNNKQALLRDTSSMLVMQYRTQLWNQAHEILKPTTDTFLDALDGVLDGLGRHLNPHDTVANVPFAELREAATDLQSKLDEVHFEALIKSETPVDPFLYSNVFVFHLSLVVLAERLLEYGERMQNFDRSRYKSQLQRTWEFFFYDYWRDFWAELPKRLTLATPRDVRIFKDAIKIACAYTVGAVYTAHMDPENVYYFGMAILMSVGLPTAGDTMEASVYRVTGMVCACSIAYVAVWHTQNLAGELAIALAGVFLSLLFRDRQPYAHTGQYCSMLIITALNSAETKLVLLSRVVSNCFTVMTYYAIVVFIFPIDVLRVTYNAQVAAITQVADRFSRLVDVISQPLSPDDPAQLASMREEVLSIRAARIPMWNALNAVGMWLPKAAADPAPLGSPYPLQAMRDMYSSLRRLGSATDVIGASLTALLSEKAPRHRPDVEHILAAVAPVMQMVDETSRVLFQDFLDAVSKPHEWSPSLATYHFSVFLSLSSALHHACWTAHRRNVKALRANFRSKVMNRTFAAAARSNVIDAQTLEQARNLSFALHASDQYLPMPVGRRRPPGEAESGPLGLDGSPTRSEHTSRAGTTAATSTAQSSVVFDAVDVAAPHSRPPTVHNASMGGGAAAAAHRDDATPAVTNGSIARTIAESVAMVRSTERRNSRLVRRADGSEPSGSFATPRFSPTLSPAAPRVGNGSVVLVPGGNRLPNAVVTTNADGQADGVEDAAEQSQREKEKEEFAKVLDPYEREAHEEERRAFIARRSLEHAQMEESSISHDVNMVLTIMVGTDMFFAEAERMLKTMYAINEYARSRVPPPRAKT